MVNNDRISKLWKNEVKNFVTLFIPVNRQIPERTSSEYFSTQGFSLYPDPIHRISPSFKLKTWRFTCSFLSINQNGYGCRP